MKRFTLRRGNHFRFLEGGDTFLYQLMELIKGASFEIRVELYLVEPGAVFDRFLYQIRRALSRGVRVYLLLDGFGSRLVLPKLRELEQTIPHLYLAVFNPIVLARLAKNFHRDHRKLLLVDHRLAIVTGFGITDAFFPVSDAAEGEAGHPWLDIAVVAEGPVVIDWLKLFEENWYQVTHEHLYSSAIVRAVGDMAGLVVSGAGLFKQHVVRSLLWRARRARKRLWIITPYFVTTSRIRRRLIHAASKRGIDVRVIVPGEQTDNPAVKYAARRYYPALLQAGVKIFEYQPTFIHAKLYICDHWTSIGSCNLDHWSYRWNLEANQEIFSRQFSEQAAEFFLQCQSNSRSITLDYWSRFGLRTKIYIRLSSWVEKWLIRLSRWTQR